jgi:hypothetical protein
VSDDVPDFTGWTSKEILDWVEANRESPALMRIGERVDPSTFDGPRGPVLSPEEGRALEEGYLRQMYDKPDRDETSAILSDPQAVADIQEAQAEIAAGVPGTSLGEMGEILKRREGHHSETLYDATSGEEIGPATPAQVAWWKERGDHEYGTFLVDKDGDPCDPSVDPAVFGPLRAVYVQ